MNTILSFYKQLMFNINYNLKIGILNQIYNSLTQLKNDDYNFQLSDIQHSEINLIMSFINNKKIHSSQSTQNLNNLNTGNGFSNLIQSFADNNNLDTSDYRDRSENMNIVSSPNNSSYNQFKGY